MLAALLHNVRRVSVLLEEARECVWRYQPRTVRAEAGAGAPTGALWDGGAGLLGTDETRDPDGGASSLRRGAVTSGAGEDVARKNDVREAPRRSDGEGADGGRRGTGGRRAGGLRRTVSSRNK